MRNASRMGGSNDENDLPLWNKILGWLISLTAFAFGFYHTAEGLMGFGILDSKVGSFLAAGLILMVLILAYNRLMSGKKSAIYFYLFCALIMFIFNLNSFYPKYLGQKLIKEDALAMKDTLVKYQTQIFENTGKNDKTIVTTVNQARRYQDQFLAEIDETGDEGFGENAIKFLAKFNKLLGSDLSLGSFKGIPENPAETKKQWRKLMDDVIDGWIEKNARGDKKTAVMINSSSKALDSLRSHYEPVLDSIIVETADWDISKPSKLKPIVDIGKAAAQFDNIGKSINVVLPEKERLPKLNDEKNQLAFPPTHDLGKFEHTINSATKRINKIDTWGPIILCFIIDFFVPLVIYFLLSGGNKRSNDFSNLFKRNPNYTRND